MGRQQGLVLFLALMMLVIMTIVGVALAINSLQSVRMAGAGADRIEAMAAANGSQQQAIDDNKGAKLSVISIDAPIVSIDTSLGVGVTVTNTIKVLDSGNVSCHRSSRASSQSSISCRHIEVSSEASFGRGGAGQLRVVSGIEQEVLAGG